MTVIYCVVRYVSHPDFYLEIVHNTSLLYKRISRDHRENSVIAIICYTFIVNLKEIFCYKMTILQSIKSYNINITIIYFTKNANITFSLQLLTKLV